VFAELATDPQDFSCNFLFASSFTSCFSFSVINSHAFPAGVHLRTAADGDAGMALPKRFYTSENVAIFAITLQFYFMLTL